MRPPQPIQGRLKSFTFHTTQEDVNIDISEITGVSEAQAPHQVDEQQQYHRPGPSAHPRSQEENSDDDDDFMQPPPRPAATNKQRITTNIVVNARRKGKVQNTNPPAKGPPTAKNNNKVTKYPHGPTIRCAPSIFNNFVDLLTMRQRTLISKMNCGGLLQIRADKLVNRELLKHLYDSVDPGTMVLDLGKDRVIHVNPFAVKQVFGLSDTGEDISLHTTQQASKALSDFKNLIGLPESADVQTKYLHDIWEADTLADSRMFDDELSIRTFFIIAFNKLLFPSTDNNIRAKDAYLSMNLSRLPNINWCKAVIDELQEAVRSWQLDKRRISSPSITGCAIFLLILYLDNLRCTHQIEDKEVPRAKYFNQDLIKKIIAADKKKDHQGKVTFGMLPLRNINDTCYYRPRRFVPHAPANIEPGPLIRFPSILAELGAVVDQTVAKPKRRLVREAFAQFDIKSKKAATFINMGQTMLQATHDQFIEKLASILESQTCVNDSAHLPSKRTAPSAAVFADQNMHDIHNGDSVESENVPEVPNQSAATENNSSFRMSLGSLTTTHTHQNSHVQMAQNSATYVAEPHDTTNVANVEAQHDMEHVDSPVHTDVTIGEVVPQIPIQVEKGVARQGSDNVPHDSVDEANSCLDSLVDLIHASSTPAAHPHDATVDSTTFEPTVLTQTPIQFPDEVPGIDSTIHEDQLQQPAVYPKPQRLTRRPSKYVSPFKGDPLRTRVPMAKAKALRNKFCPNLNSLNKVFISTGYIEFTGEEIFGSFPYGQELTSKFMSYFVECLTKDETAHMPDGGGYRLFLSHKIGEYVNIEDEEEFSLWESHNALEILESDISEVDPAKVKLFFLPILHECHFSVYCINFIHDRIDILDPTHDHRYYHEVLGNRIIPRLDHLFQMATIDKLKSFSRFKRPIIPVPAPEIQCDCGFFAIKFMELWTGECRNV